MKRFLVTQDLDWVQGHLRYGHKVGIVEAESLEEAEEMFADGDTDMLDVIVDDYEIDDYDDGGNEIVIVEIKE